MSSHDFSHPAYFPPLTESTAETFIFLNFPPKFVPGVSCNIAWSLILNGTISLRLVEGPINNPKHISTIAHFIENKGNFFWTPSISIAPGDNYALQIVSDDDEELFVYSPHFSIANYIVRRKDLDASFASSAVATAHASATVPIEASTIKSTAISTSHSSSQAAVIATSSAKALTATSSPKTIVTDTASTKAALTQTSSLGTDSTLQTLTQTISTGATTASSTSATDSATNSATGQATSGGLSSGAAAGIGVGATLGGLLIIGAIVFFILRFRRRKRPQQPESDHPSVPELGGGRTLAPEPEPEKQPEKDLKFSPHSPQMAEMAEPLSPAEYGELDRRRRAAELEGRSSLPAQPGSPRAELEARRSLARQVYEIGPTA